MKILAVSTWFPCPPSNGARMRANFLLREIGRRHDLDLLAIFQSEADNERLGDARDFCRRVQIFPSHDFDPATGAGWRELFSNEPRSFAARFSPELMEASLLWAKEADYDAVIAVTLGAAPYAAGLDIPLKVLDQHNVESEILRRQWKTEEDLKKKLRFAPTWIKARRHERFLGRKFDLIAVVSDREKALMRRLIGRSAQKIAVIPNGVDPELLDYRLPQKDPNAIVFSGSVTYQPNMEAVDILCREIMPKVRSRFPDARLIVTGGYDGVDISSFRRNPWVEFTGFVDDIRPIVAGSSVLATPLISGGGTRLKILEGMGLGTPVVSTAFGAEGLEMRDGTDLLIAESPEEFSRAIMRLLEDRDLSMRISRKAREAVRERFRWTEIARHFESEIATHHKGAQK